MRKSAATMKSVTFDIFLSHAHVDALAIVGVAEALASQNLKVYVDWIDDPQLDRSNISVHTANVLQQRMRQSEALIFALSDSSSYSVWMPWELGYFNGIKPGHMAILPIVNLGVRSFPGQEYLGLYPLMEDVGIGGKHRLGIRLANQSSATPQDLVMSRVERSD